MTINATKRFPLDDLLQCAQCGGPLHLVNIPPKLAYTCAGSTDQPECPAPPLWAEDLNRRLLSQVMSMIITSATRNPFQAAVRDALAEAGHEAGAAETIFGSASLIPDWLLTPEAAPEGGAVLARFINRIRVEPGVAEVEYKLPLPAGTPLSGKLRQNINLPESLLA